MLFFTEAVPEPCTENQAESEAKFRAQNNSYRYRYSNISPPTTSPDAPHLSNSTGNARDGPISCRISVVIHDHPNAPRYHPYPQRTGKQKVSNAASVQHAHHFPLNGNGFPILPFSIPEPKELDLPRISYQSLPRVAHMCLELCNTSNFKPTPCNPSPPGHSRGFVCNSSLLRTQLPLHLPLVQIPIIARSPHANLHLDATLLEQLIQMRR